MSQTQRIHHFINGEFTASPDARYFDKRSPVDGSVIAHIAEAGQAEVNAAVTAARAALKGEWGKLSTDQRVDLLDGVANEITRRFDDFVAAEMADTGQPSHVQTHVFIPRGAANFKVFADMIKNVPAEFLRNGDAGRQGRAELRDPQRPRA
jgi:aminomuconate-semialdehyde/2-hydroxymuconate-6-semialdehyde dehydrogenase